RRAGDPGERHGVVGIGTAAELAADELDVIRQHIELLGGDALELVRDPLGGKMGGDSGAGGEAAGIGGAAQVRGVRRQEWLRAVIYNCFFAVSISSPTLLSSGVSPSRSATICDST